MQNDKLNPREALGFLAWKVTRLVVNDMTARFTEAGIGVTVEQWRALIPIYKMDGLTQGQLCEVLTQEKTGVSRLVAALEKRKLIRREPGKKDRRVKSLFITKEGKELIDGSVETVLASRKGMVEGVDPDELATCYKVLWQIIKTNDPHWCPKGDCEDCSDTDSDVSCK